MPIAYGRGLVRWQCWRLRLWFLAWRHPRTRRDLAGRLMERDAQPPVAQNGAQPSAQPDARSTRYLLLVRHGQATYNVEGRHPGHLPHVPLTDEGRRQAHMVAVALAALPLSAVVSSPLQRARDTAAIIARGWALPLRLDPRLLDTNVGPFAGKTGVELKDVPAWRAFLEHPTEPPPGVESLADVQARALATIEELARASRLGDYLVVVTHADVIKLALAHYLGIAIASVGHLAIGNATVSALAFRGSDPPEVLAINWQPGPAWLTPPLLRPAEAAPSALAAEPPTIQSAQPAAVPSADGTHQV